MSSIKRRVFAPLIITVLGVICAGCSVPVNNIQAAQSTVTPTMFPTSSAPDIGITAHAPTATAPKNGCDPVPQPLQYTGEVALDLPKHTLTATLTTTYKNSTGRVLDRLAFYIPLGEGRGDAKNVFFLTSLSSDPVSVDYKLEGARLDVSLKDALQPGCKVRVQMGFRIDIPLIPEGAAGGFGYFGHSERQTNLGDWLPTLAPYLKGEWVIPRSWYIGETRVTDMANYTITFRVDGASSPARLEVAAPGTIQRTDATTWQITLERGRNFAVSVSDSFIRETVVTRDGVTIDLYRFPVAAGNDSPAHALNTARETSETFTLLFGPLPYKRMAVVQGDFPDGMEFSGIFFVSTNWFTKFWEGKPDGWLTLITAHEMAHQWWYSAVGDEQALHPYLDEAFAIYSEVIYLEKRYPELVDWWWKWRVEQYKPTGMVDASVYDFTQVRPYINAVYLRGAQMLREIRETIGERAFFTWLHRYAEIGADRIFTPAELWGLLSSEDYAKIAAIRAKYLTQPDPAKP